MSKCERSTMRINNPKPTHTEYEPQLAEKNICAVITAKATYSLSPAMHNRAYEATGLADRFVYVARSTSPMELNGVIQEVRSGGNYRGLSIGVPHKQAVMPLLDVIDDAAKKIGAVNTVVIDRVDGTPVLRGFNTDWIGIREPLKARLELKGKKVAVVGAGGAARAAVYAVMQEGANTKVYNRTLERAQALGAEFGCQAGSLDELSEIQEADVIIHATKLGMQLDDPLLIPIEFIKPHHVLFDVVYTREFEETDLAIAAKEQGATVIQGREMLLWQGVEQFRLFTGLDAPVEVMRGAIV